VCFFLGYPRLCCSYFFFFLFIFVFFFLFFSSQDLCCAMWSCLVPKSAGASFLVWLLTDPFFLPYFQQMPPSVCVLHGITFFFRLDSRNGVDVFFGRFFSPRFALLWRVAEVVLPLPRSIYRVFGLPPYPFAVSFFFRFFCYGLPEALLFPAFSPPVSAILFVPCCFLFPAGRLFLFFLFLGSLAVAPSSLFRSRISRRFSCSYDIFDCSVFYSPLTGRPPHTMPSSSHFFFLASPGHFFLFPLFFRCVPIPLLTRRDPLPHFPFSLCLALPYLESWRSLGVLPALF